ncbi:hypothetical protein F5B20DRAFT_535297 [Whalleya microplaca]|nr:hypothetical protein F5B20DRAFT_535297 [Whalleya microplaca]
MATDKKPATVTQVRVDGELEIECALLRSTNGRLTPVPEASVEFDILRLGQHIATVLFNQPIAKDALGWTSFTLRRDLGRQPTHDNNVLLAKRYRVVCSIVLRPQDHIASQQFGVVTFDEYDKSTLLRGNAILFLDDQYIAKYARYLQASCMQDADARLLSRNIFEMAGFWIGVLILRVSFSAILCRDFVRFSKNPDIDSTMRDWMERSTDLFLMDIFRGRLEFARSLSGFDVITDAYLVYRDPDNPKEFKEIMWNINPRWIHNIITYYTIGTGVTAIKPLTKLRGDSSIEVHLLIPSRAATPQAVAAEYVTSSQTMIKTK